MNSEVDKGDTSLNGILKRNVLIFATMVCRFVGQPRYFKTLTNYQCMI
jgi:hypothetical protein